MTSTRLLNRGPLRFGYRRARLRLEEGSNYSVVIHNPERVRPGVKPDYISLFTTALLNVRGFGAAEKCIREVFVFLGSC